MNSPILTRKEVAALASMTTWQFIRHEAAMGLDKARVRGTKGKFARWRRTKVYRILGIEE